MRLPLEVRLEVITKYNLLVLILNASISHGNGLWQKKLSLFCTSFQNILVLIASSYYYQFSENELFSFHWEAVSLLFYTSTNQTKNYSYALIMLALNSWNVLVLRYSWHLVSLHLFKSQCQLHKYNEQANEYHFSKTVDKTKEKHKRSQKTRKQSEIYIKCEIYGWE